MLKAKATIGGREVLILGLSHANLDKLREQGLRGRIEIKAEDIDIPFDIIITAAPTEQHMIEAFQSGIGADTKVHISDKLKS